jgi:2-keto-4-pentenoate hydratase/2-oxohepta-3-ene-1,7-dioic acid hydratase in catechol pathway
MGSFATYRGPDGSRSWGVVRDGGIVDGPGMLARAGGAPAGDLLTLIRHGPPAWQTVDRMARESWPDHDLAAVSLAAPIAPPRDVLAIGVNYATHAEEARKAGAVTELPAAPIVFNKATTSVCGPQDPIRWWPSLTSQLDYEIELGVVIGVGGRHIRREAALGHVFGYTVLNDVSARDVQHGRPGGQWFLGKSMDTFCPLGPWIVTAGEIGDPQNLELTLSVNGERRQHSNTRHMIFGVADLIAEISRYITMLPGDVIATGTPEGVGAAMESPRFLGDGDVIEAEIAGIGRLRNRVVRSE